MPGFYFYSSGFSLKVSLNGKDKLQAFVIKHETTFIWVLFVCDVVALRNNPVDRKGGLKIELKWQWHT